MIFAFSKIIAISSHRFFFQLPKNEFDFPSHPTKIE